MPQNAAHVIAHPTPLEALLARAHLTPDATALVADGQVWTCGRLASESARLADAFRTRGVRPGDRIAVHMFNRAEAALAYLACWRTGAIAVTLNTRYKAGELAALLARVRPGLYLGEAALCDGVREVASDVLASDARFVAGLDQARDDARPWTDLMSLAAGSGAEQVQAAPDRDGPAMLLATSGTTGKSKLVVWTQRTLAAFTPGAPSRGLDAVATLLLVTPMMHASGAYLFAAALSTGAVMVLLPRFEPEAALDAIADHRCTTVLALPFVYSQLAHLQKEHPRNIASLRFCFTGGDVCSDEIAQAFADAAGSPLLSMWAATEDSFCGVPVTGPGPLTGLMPETEVRLVDETGAEVPDGETGEFLVRSPATTPGYWLGPEQIEPLPEGWFHTGDLMCREPDGRLRFAGRSKDLIVRGGSNISPVEVEDVLLRQPGVADAAVAGLPDPELGERLGAMLVLAEGTAEKAVPDILAGVRRELADYKVPETALVVDTIPRNALTKVDRPAVAAAIVADRTRT